MAQIPRLPSLGTFGTALWGPGGTATTLPAKGPPAQRRFFERLPWRNRHSRFLSRTPKQILRGFSTLKGFLLGAPGGSALGAGQSRAWFGKACPYAAFVLLLTLKPSKRRLYK